MKDFKDFLLYGFLVQKNYKNKPNNYNAVDSNFLNSNTMFQMHVIGTKMFFETSLKHRTDDFFALWTDEDEGIIRRYYKNDTNVHTDVETTRWTDPRTVSRDNSMGCIILAGHTGRHEFVRKFALNTLKRGSFFQNTITTTGEKKFVPDLCGPTQWATIVRAMFEKKYLFLLYPLLLTLDFFYMLHLIFDALKTNFEEENSTVYHVFSAILQKDTTINTPFSYIGGRFYMKYRKAPKDFVSVDLQEKQGFLVSLEKYSSKIYDPPIHLVSEKVYKNFYKNNL